MQHVSPRPPIDQLVQRIDGVTDLKQLNELFAQIIAANRDMLAQQISLTQSQTLLQKLLNRVIVIENEMGYFPGFVQEKSSLRDKIRQIFFGYTQPNYFTQDVQKEDVTQNDLHLLKDFYLQKKARTKIKGGEKQLSYERPIPREYFQLTGEETERLLNNSKLKLSRQVAQELLQLAKDIIHETPSVHDKWVNLMKRAINGHFANLTVFLLFLKNEVEASAATENKLIDLAQEKALDFAKTGALNSFDVLKACFEARTPMDKEGLCSILFEVLQKYQSSATSENKHYNNKELDDALSSMLGVRVKMDELALEFGSTYIGHVNHLKEHKIETLPKETIETIERDSLEGFHADDYFKVHLRLFFQKIVETILVYKEIDDRILQEFLCELETGWVVNRFFAVYESQMSDPMRASCFKQILVPYLYRQIERTPSDQEYVVHVALPRHSIYIAFHKNKDESISIRVDNLGGYSKDLNNVAYKRHIADITLPVNSDELKEYLNRLLNTSRICRTKSLYSQVSNEEKYKLAEEVYDVRNSIFNFPTSQKKDPPPFKMQRSGNCTHYSLVIGQCLRLNDPNAEFFLSLGAVMQKNVNLGVHPITTQVIAEPYRSTLQRMLLNRYAIFRANLHPEQFMESGLLQEDFLKDTQSRYLIEGSAGMGKTTFSEQLAYQLQSSPSSDMVVFHLHLRDLVKLSGKVKCTLMDVVETCILNQKIPFSERSLLQKQIDNPQAVWILDGLDEFVVQPSLTGLVGSLFEKDRLVVTTRPDFSMELAGLLVKGTFKRVEMRDYEQSEKLKFIKNRFSVVTPQYNKLKTIIENSSEGNDSELSHQFTKLSSTPITLAKVCDLLQDSKYETILEAPNLAVINGMFLASLQEKAYYKTSGNPPSSPYAIKKLYERYLKYVEKLAFRSIEKSRQTIFTPEIRQKSFPEDPIFNKELENVATEVGLLQLDQGGGQFIHASYQEYLAARYIMRRIKCDQASLKFQEVDRFIQQHRYDFQYTNVFVSVIQMYGLQIDKKGPEGLRRFLQFLEIFLPEGSHKLPSMTVVGEIYEVVKRNRSTLQVEDFIQNRLNRRMKELFASLDDQMNYPGQWRIKESLQELLALQPDLREELGLNGLITQRMKDPNQSWSQLRRTILFIDAFQLTLPQPDLMTWVLSQGKSIPMDQSPAVLKALDRAAILDHNNPLVLPFINYVVNSASEIKKLINKSNQLSKKGCRNRTENWRQIGEFLSDSFIINLIDQKKPGVIDEIIKMIDNVYDGPVDGRSHLHSEVQNAILRYGRGGHVLTELDKKRMKTIGEKYKMKRNQNVNANTQANVPAWGFKFDYSPYARALTIKTIKEYPALILKEPQTIIYLKNLRAELEAESAAIDSIDKSLLAEELDSMNWILDRYLTPSF